MPGCSLLLCTQSLLHRGGVVIHAGLARLRQPFLFAEYKKVAYLRHRWQSVFQYAPQMAGPALVRPSLHLERLRHRAVPSNGGKHHFCLDVVSRIITINRGLLRPNLGLACNGRPGRCYRRDDGLHR